MKSDNRLRTTAPIATKPARGALRLIISGIIAGVVFSPIVESTGGLVGLWHTPAHSAAVLDRTAAVLAQPLRRLRITPIVFIPSSHPSNPPFDLLLRHLAAAANSLQTSILRLCSAVLFLPAIALITTVTIADALLTRNYRRLRAEREHGYIFHRLQRLRGIALFWPIFFVLVQPSYLPPIAIAAAILPSIAYLWLNMTLFKRNI